VIKFLGIIFEKSELNPVLQKHYQRPQLSVLLQWVCRKDLLNFSGSLMAVTLLRTPHSALSLAFCSSDTNSHHLTLEKISEPSAEDHCFILHVKRTFTPFSFRQALTKQVSFMKLKYTDHVRDSIS
jgi:hypothetical protein